MFTLGHSPSKKGRTTTADPIKDIKDVEAIKELLRDNVRDLALFTVAVNSAFRVGDLCNLRWEDTVDDDDVITLRVLEGKTKKPRIVPLNRSASATLRAWRAQCESEYVFSGQRGQMSTSTFGKLVKKWCAEVGLKGQFSAHTTRKAWIRLQIDHFGTPLPVVMTAVNHSDPKITLAYCGKLSDEVQLAYSNSL